MINEGSDVRRSVYTPIRQEAVPHHRQGHATHADPGGGVYPYMGPGDPLNRLGRSPGLPLRRRHPPRRKKCSFRVFIPRRGLHCTPWSHTGRPTRPRSSSMRSSPPSSPNNCRYQGSGRCGASLRRYPGRRGIFWRPPGRLRSQATRRAPKYTSSAGIPAK